MQEQCLELVISTFGSRISECTNHGEILFRCEVYEFSAKNSIVGRMKKVNNDETCVPSFTERGNVGSMVILRILLQNAILFRE